MGNVLCKSVQSHHENEDEPQRGRRKKRNPLRWLRKYFLRRNNKVGPEYENEDEVHDASRAASPVPGTSKAMVTTSPSCSGSMEDDEDDIDCASSDSDVSQNWQHGVSRDFADTPVAGSDSFFQSRVNAALGDFETPGSGRFQTVVGGSRRPSKASVSKMLFPASLTGHDIEKLYKRYWDSLELWEAKEEVSQKCASPAFPNIPSRYTTFPAPRPPSLYGPTRVSEVIHTEYEYRPLTELPLRGLKPHMYVAPDCARVSFPPTENYEYRQKDVKGIPGEHPWTRAPSFQTHCQPLPPRISDIFPLAVDVASMDVLPQDKQIELVKREEGAFPGRIIYEDESTPEMFRLELPKVLPDPPAKEKKKGFWRWKH